MVHSAAQKSAAQAGQVKAAHLGQHVHAVGGIGLVPGYGSFNGPDLPGKALVGQAGAAAGHFGGGTVQKDRQHGSGGGGVADAHFTGGNEAYPPFLQVPDGLHTHENGPLRLLPGHGRLLDEIPGAAADVFLHQAWMIHKIGHADVHRADFRPGHPGHFAHAGLPFGHIGSHDGSDLLAGLGDALGHDAVVAAENRHSLVLNGKIRGAENAGHPYHHLFQQAQGTQGLAHGVPFFLGQGHGLPVGGGDAGENLLQNHLCHSFESLV